MNPFDPGIHMGPGGGIYGTGEDLVCDHIATVSDRPAGITAEICVRSRRGGGKLVTARSPARSYRRARQGKTEWGFGVITVSMGSRQITFTEPRIECEELRFTP